jgi:hypothetical protein
MQVTSSASQDVSLEAPGPAAATASESQLQLPAAVLAEWLKGRVAWFIRALASMLPAVEDGAHIAFLLQVRARLCSARHRMVRALSSCTHARFDSQQTTYAARRAGRLGADYSHLLAPIFHSHIRSLSASRSADAAMRCASALYSWQWAHRATFDELPSQPAATGYHNDGGSAQVYLQPSSQLLSFPPLAELANAALNSYNALRTCIPAAASAWIMEDCVLVLQVRLECESVLI